MYGLTPYPTHDPVNSRLLRHLCTAKKIEQPPLPADRTEKKENRGVSTILFVVVDASYHKGIAVYFTTTFLAYGDSETLLGPQSRFEVNPLKVRVGCPENGTAVPNGLLTPSGTAVLIVGTKHSKSSKSSTCF